MIRIFKNLEEYNTFTNNGKNMVSGDLYWVKENKRAFFLTNNIDGEVKSYDMFDEIPDGYIQPSGNIAITENGEGIDVTNYATASVNVPSTGGGNEDLINLIEGDVTSFDIPDGTIKIGDGVFAYTSLNTVTIPDSVTSIGEYAFAYSFLRTVTIPDTVTSIGEYAFYNCTSISKVTIGSGVTEINSYAFKKCTFLDSITIKATTPPTLGSAAFHNTNNCPIYVPAESVDAYKTATNWSAYADRIQAIPTV